MFHDEFLYSQKHLKRSTYRRLLKCYHELTGAHAMRAKRASPSAGTRGTYGAFGPSPVTP